MTGIVAYSTAAVSSVIVLVAGKRYETLLSDVEEVACPPAIYCSYLSVVVLITGE